MFVVLLFEGHKYFHFFSKMATLLEKITALEARIVRLEEREEAAEGDERRELAAMITARSNNLHDLHTQLEREQQQQQQGMSLILFMIFIRHLPPFLTIV